MTSDLTISIEVGDSEHYEKLSNVLMEMGYMQIVESPREKLRQEPQVVFVDDSPGKKDVFARIASLSQNYPEARIFAVLQDQRPEYIISVMKAGADEIFFQPLDSPKIRRALDNIDQARIDRLPFSTAGKLFSFVGAKGGLGSTFLTVNTAMALMCKKEKTTGALDFHFHAGDVAVFLDYVPKATIKDICLHFKWLDFSFFQKALSKHRSGLHFLAAPPRPEDVKKINDEHADTIIDLARSAFDFTVVDCPPLGACDRFFEVFTESDKIIILMDLSVPAVRNALRLGELLENRKTDPAKIEFAVNRFVKGQGLNVRDVEKKLGKDIFWFFSNDYQKAIKSVNHGTPLITESPESRLSRNIFDFVEKLTDSPSNRHYRGVRGLFGRAI
jgi:pilus assembly protein CpaE